MKEKVLGNFPLHFCTLPPTIFQHNNGIRSNSVSSSSNHQSEELEELKSFYIFLMSTCTFLIADVSTPSASGFPRELGAEEELSSTEDSQVVLVDLDKEVSETDEIRNTSNETFSPESPDQPNSSEVIKGSFISLAGFSLLWLSLMFAI
ncbi:hypothetical protein SprV_0602231000 [Sparganum proliferum]